MIECRDSIKLALNLKVTCPRPLKLQVTQGAIVNGQSTESFRVCPTRCRLDWTSLFYQLDGAIIIWRAHGPSQVRAPLFFEWILHLHIRYVCDCESSIPLILSGSCTIQAIPQGMPCRVAVGIFNATGRASRESRHGSNLGILTSPSLD